ncbi:hypothetical protein TPE_0863 [Treponema pedis str. T A4]|uniref:Uncharacterized protein n=1 Tax=Treponema pedis str. T A4 TaxID=1291379 RepID=S6A879_9SPIR|nr:hypothetical protein TPE_0863 [Treponema pedis str. T A4]
MFINKRLISLSKDGRDFFNFSFIFKIYFAYSCRFQNSLLGISNSIFIRGNRGSFFTSIIRIFFSVWQFLLLHDCSDSLQDLQILKALKCG